MGLVLLALFATFVGSLLLQPPTVQAREHRATAADVNSIIDNVFGPNAAAAKRVAMCESSMNPYATNKLSIGGSNAAGLFQILYPSTWVTTSQAANSPYDAQANTIAAHEIFVRDGYSWREWVCQP